jgi:hypothetical protein
MSKNQLVVLMVLVVIDLITPVFAAGSIRFFWGTDSNGNALILSTDSVLTLCWILCQYSVMMMVGAAVLRILRYSVMR